MMNNEKTNLISYQIFDEYGFGIFSTSCASQHTIIKLNPKISGTMLIGELAFEISEGICMPDLRMLPAGEHNVLLRTDEKIIYADKLMKEGGAISLAPKGENELRALRATLISVQSNIKALNEKILKITEKIDGASVL